MKWTLLLIVQLLLAICISGQQIKKAPLKLESWALSLCVTPAEQFIITTKAAEIALSDSLNGSWRKAPLLTEGYIPGINIEQGNFFNRDTGFISGFINNNDKYNIIYHTTDAGKHWKKVDFGMDGYVDAVCNLDNGEAWMSVAGEGIAYTTDCGITWRQLPIASKKQRFSTMFFNSKREGIAASIWNNIAYTTDNCQHWTVLPTPLDQHKYDKTDKISRPSLYRVAIYKDYFLVNQEDMVFYSRRDSINWTILPLYTDFVTDATNSALYFITEHNVPVRADDRFLSVFQYTAPAAFRSLSCRNGSLFATDGERILQYKNDNTVLQAVLKTDEIEKTEPEYFGNSDTCTYGAIDNRIFTKSFTDEDWKHAFTLPFSTNNAHKLIFIRNGILLCHKNNDSLYYYDIVSKKVREDFLPALLQRFGEGGIASITFRKGSQGCFHNYENTVSYVRKKGKYVLTRTSLSAHQRKEQLKADTRQFDTTIVENLVRSMHTGLHKGITIGDLGFTEKDYLQCKKDIRAYQEAPADSHRPPYSPGFYFNRNNINFDKLLAIVDSIKTIDTAKLNNALQHLSDSYSTTENWIKVVLKDSDGNTMSISSSYYEPNAFCFPWQISINGASLSTLSIAITQFIQQVFPSLLPETNKVPVLYQLVKQLYK